MKRGLLVAVSAPLAIVAIVPFFSHLHSALTLLIGAGAVGYAFRKYQAEITIRNLPTARARSAAIGLAELSGRARCDVPTTSPVTRTPSAAWHAVIERYERKGSSARWKEVFSRVDFAPVFEIEDDSGRLLVWPADADLKFANVRKWHSKHGPPPDTAAPVLERLGIAWPSPGDRAPVRMSEMFVRDGDPLYVIGTLMEQGQIDVSARNRRASSWTNGWIRAFTPLHPPEIDPGRVVLWKGDRGRPFILADSEQQALDGMRSDIWPPLAFGLLFVALSLFTLF